MHINISLLKTVIDDLVLMGHPLSLKEARCLEIPFSEEEVFSALLTLNRDKPQVLWVYYGFLAYVLGLC